ncbi:MAG TPA: DNA topoisomerase (ATP-hydrolyzing) [Thermomicrobiaceae bacterium]|nr:DNA topoisomerase (ATP-hydrolyzing) [Thermomicrobiaceae bacterium]
MTTTTLTNGFGRKETIETEDFSSLFEDAFTQYALSVVTSRALPDARDGLKPVHRRILWCMHENGYRSTRTTVKSASVVGDVLKSYHPHGDGAVYDAAVRMAQNFTMRYPLIEGQGNFGSIDGDTAAAYRYTEMRLSPIGELLLRDIEQETVPFEQTYLQDPKVLQPVYLPARIPPICNPASGIAVGLSTEIPPHNLNEAIQAAILLLDNSEASLDELLRVLKGPDFPTGGRVMGDEGIRDYFARGKGRLVVRGEVRLEQELRQRNLVVTEIPPISRARLVKSMIAAVNEGKVTGVTDIRNESDEEKGTRVVIELERGATPEVVLNQLYRFSDLETAITVNMVFLFGDEGQPARQPKQTGMLDLLRYWNRHQLDVITRRAEFQLRKARERLHIVEGLIIGAANADAIVRIFQKAADRTVAKEQIKKKYKLSDIQADVIANMTLAQVTRLDAAKYAEERDELTRRIEELTALLASEVKKVALLKEELREIVRLHGDARRTRVDTSGGAIEEVASLVEERQVLLVVSESGKVKAVPENAFRRSRGNGGARKGDGMSSIVPMSTLDYLLVLTRQGRVYLARGHEVPEGTRAAAGEPARKTFNLRAEETLATVLPTDELRGDRFVVWFSANGKVKKTALSEYRSINAAGLNDLKLLSDDRVVAAALVDDAFAGGDFLVVTSDGQALRFADEELRATGRDGQGVNAITLKKGATVVGALALAPGSDEDLLVVSEQGMGKRTALKEFPQRHRATGGITAMALAGGDRLAVATPVGPRDEVIVASAGGQSAQFGMKGMRRQGRATKGTLLLELPTDDRVSTIARLAAE